MYENLNPSWVPPQEFHFHCPTFSSIHRKRLLIDVMDFDYLDRDDYLGTVTYNLSKLSATVPDTGVAEDLTLTLVDVKTGSSINSTVSIKVSVLTQSSFASIRTDVVFEYERWTPTGKWGSDYPGHLLPSDPGSWSDENAKVFGME